MRSDDSGLSLDFMHAVSRHRRAALGVFLIGASLVLSLGVLWPAGVSRISALVGIAVSGVAAVAAALVLSRRSPYFSSRGEVERVLQLPVLAACLDKPEGS
jgi:hypothetical protein